MKLNYKTYCTRDNLKEIRKFVGESLQQTILTDIEINQIILAVDEVCANLIIHSHACNPEDEIEIVYQQEPNEILFEIIDYDAPFFDISSYQKPTINHIKKQKRKGGMGLLLVNSIMDEVEVTHHDNTNVWRLRKTIILPTA